MTKRFAVLMIVALLYAAPVWAQTEQGAVASLEVAAAALESSTNLAIAGSIGYRFNRVIGFGLEVTSIPGLEPDLSRGRQPSILDGTVGSLGLVGIEPIAGDGGRATIFTMNVRLEVPTTTARVIPYVVAGGGVGAIREEFTENIFFAEPLLQQVPDVALPPIRIQPQRITRASTNLALTLGGGASVVLTKHSTFDADLRYVYLTGSRDVNVGRFGVGLSYRF